MRTELDRFESKVVRDPAGCWLWVGSCDACGYGTFWSSERRVLGAHRVGWRLYGKGPLPPEVDHGCGVRNCVNPDHLRASTRKGNTRARHRTSARSGFKGVYQHSSGRYRAGICVDGKLRWLGMFDTAADAARAYDSAALREFGEFAVTNTMKGRL